MPDRSEFFRSKARIVVEALLPSLSEEAVDALVFLIVDFLQSLDAISENVGES